jgi:hypothetical protein
LSKFLLELCVRLLVHNCYYTHFLAVGVVNDKKISFGSSSLDAMTASACWRTYC